MEYSPIKELAIKNFRNLGDIKISFEESPIVTLEGENEAGKTSVVKAIAVMGANAYTTRHKKYIRTGSNGWGIVCELQDGTSIARIVTNATNTLAILKNGEEVWRADKIDRGEGTPVKLAEIMGFIRETETQEMLNVRTYEDQLLFIVTPASTNYKVMYDALKIAQITRAIKLGTTQANQLKAVINSNELRIEALMDNIRGVRLYDIEPVVNIKNRIESEISKLETLERAISIMQRISQIESELGALSEISTKAVMPVDIEMAASLVDVYRRLSNIQSLSKVAEKYSELASCTEIDSMQLSQITQAISISERSKEQIKNIQYLSEINKCEVINDTGITGLERAISLASHIRLIKKSSESLRPIIELGNTFDVERMAQAAMNIVTSYSKYAQSYNELIAIKQQMESITAEIKTSGGIVVSCTNCGETVAVSQE